MTLASCDPRISVNRLFISYNILSLKRVNIEKKRVFLYHVETEDTCYLSSKCCIDEVTSDYPAYFTF